MNMLTCSSCADFCYTDNDTVKWAAMTTTLTEHNKRKEEDDTSRHITIMGMHPDERICQYEETTLMKDHPDKRIHQ